MRRILLTSVAGLAFSGATAFAADLPARAPAIAPAPVFTQTYFSWTGLYVGLNAGGAWTGDRCNNFRPVTAGGAGVLGFAAGCTGSGSNDIAFTGGGQLGYNWQFGSLVAGVEADLNYLGGRNRNTATLAVGAPAPTAFQGSYLVNDGRDHGNYFGTVRARLGFALDRALFYVTGGLAYGEKGGASVATFTGNNPVGNNAVYTAARRGDGWGWTVGAGLEYAVTNNWTVRGEYLYADLGGRRGGAYTCATTAGTTCADQFGAGGAAPGGSFVGSGGNRGLHVVRIGVNYLFNSSPSRGVVAAY